MCTSNEAPSAKLHTCWEKTYQSPGLPDMTKCMAQRQQANLQIGKIRQDPSGLMPESKDSFEEVWSLRKDIATGMIELFSGLVPLI